MPLLKAASSKSKPNKVIDYITREDKAKIVSSMNLDDHYGYAKQFKETSDIFNKNKKFDDRKYYHFKLSANPIDNVSYETHHRFAEEFVKRAFPNYESVIATHTDTDVIHSHIVINSINMENGKKIRISPNDYAKLKDFANELGLSYNLTPLDFNKSAEIKIDQKEIYIELKGGNSWKQELREVIDFSLKHSSNMEMFEKILNKYGVTITRNNGNTISYKHPHIKKSIRGQRLGAKYSRKEILHEFNEKSNRDISVKLTRVASITEESGISERSAEKDNRRQFNRNEQESGSFECGSQKPKNIRREQDNRIEEFDAEDSFEFENGSREIDDYRNYSQGFNSEFGGQSM